MEEFPLALQPASWSEDTGTHSKHYTVLPMAIVLFCYSNFFLVMILVETFIAHWLFSIVNVPIVVLLVLVLVVVVSGGGSSSSPYSCLSFSAILKIGEHFISVE